MRCLVTISCALWSVGALPSQEAGPLSGSAAPVNTWYTRGGCAARTGVALTQPIARAPNVMWNFVAAGDLVGEPLVWGGVVVLEESSGDVHLLRILRLRTGRPYTSPIRVKTTEPLHPCIWQQHIAFRAGANQLRVIEVGGSDWQPVWQVKTKDKSVIAPLLLGDELFVLTSQTLDLYSLATKKLVWSYAAKSGFGGLPSVRGDRVFVIEPALNNISVVDRKKGTLLGGMTSDGGDGVSPVSGAAAMVVAGKNHIAMYRADPPADTLGPGSKFQDKNVFLFSATDFGYRPLEGYAHSSPPCLSDTAMYSLLTNAGRTREGQWIEGQLKTLQPRFSVLASSQRDAGLLTRRASVSVTRS